MALYDVNRIALRNPNPSNGGSKPVKSDVVWHYYSYLQRGATLEKFSDGRSDADGDA